MVGPLNSATPWRRAGLALLALGVLLAHGCVTSQLSQRLADARSERAMPARIEVAYVRELAPAPPPVVAAPAAPVAPPPALSKRPRAPAPAASASRAKPALAAAEPEPDTPVAVAPPEATASAPEPELALAPAVPEAPAEAAAQAPVTVTPAAAAPASAASSAAPGAVAFEWPASTRLTYKLTGNYRGEVQGDAQVEWVHVGERYQVHLDVTVGARIAPIITRRMSSDGEITAQGLAPQRYDEDTKVIFRDRRRLTVLFEPDAVLLANGQRRERWHGMQDTASQFVQMSWLFATQPGLLRAGGSVELPLALPRNVDRWFYDVIGEETLSTTFGELDTFHLKPRRAARAGDLSAEIWFAPQLRYLPVRIRINQDADTFIDLMISRRPEMAGP